MALLYDASCLILLVNACHYCSSEVKYNNPMKTFRFFSSNKSFQASNLIESVEKYAFWSNDDFQLYRMKHEISSQIKIFPVSFDASGFFVVSREQLGRVSPKNIR